MRSAKASHVEDAQRQRQVTAREPDAVARTEIVRVPVRRPRRRRVQDHDVARVAHAASRRPCTRQPRSTPSCTKRNSAGQPPACSNAARRIADRALPDHRDLARRAPDRRRAGAAPSRARGAPPGRAAATRELDQPELRVGRERARDAASASGAASSASSSRKNSSSPRTCGDAGVAPGRDAVVAPAARRPWHAVRHAVRARSRCRPRRRRPRRRSWRSSDSTARAQVVRPPAGRQHDAAERGRHRSRSEARIANRRPAAVIAATGTSAIDEHARRLQVAEREVEQRGGERQQRRLDRHERAEEREEAERPAQPRAARTARGAATAAVSSTDRLAGLGARDVHERALRPHHQRQHRREQPERRVRRRSRPSRRRRGCRARSAAPSRSRSGASRSR